MARIAPLEVRDLEIKSESRAAMEEIQAAHGRVTNMKRTLARSPVALRALMTWYDLRDEVVPFLGERLMTLFAHAISAGTDCLVCSTFFRRLLIDARIVWTGGPSNAAGTTKKAPTIRLVG